MNFSFNGKDLADNIVEVENFIDNAIFAVDNLPPTYYETGEVITVGNAFSVLFKNPWRYLIAGLFFS